MNYTTPTCEVTAMKARCWTNTYCEIAVTDWSSCCLCTLCFVTPRSGGATTKTNKKSTTVVMDCCSLTHSLSRSTAAATALIELSTTDTVLWMSSSPFACSQMSFLSTRWRKMGKMAMHLLTAERCENHTCSVSMCSWMRSSDGND